jgi:hypothetical protein
MVGRDVSGTRDPRKHPAAECRCRRHAGAGWGHTYCSQKCVPGTGIRPALATPCVCVCVGRGGAKQQRRPGAGGGPRTAGAGCNQWTGTAAHTGRDGSGSGKVRVSHLPARQHIRVSGVYPYPRKRAGKIFDPYPYPQDIRGYRATRYPSENNMRVCDHVHFTKCINSLTDII